MNSAFYKNKSFIFELMEKQLIKLFVAASDVLFEFIEGDVAGEVRFGLSYITLDKQYLSEYVHPADYDSNEAGQIYLHMLSIFNMSEDLLQDSMVKQFTIEWDISAGGGIVPGNKITLITEFSADAYSVYLNDVKSALINQEFSEELGKSELEYFCNALTEQFLQAEKK